jgi:hypothetical protein
MANSNSIIQQIEERQKEVAALTGIGGARAAFQKFQGIQKQFPQPTLANQKMAATLPRAQKLGNGPTTMGRAKMVENGKGGGQKVNGNNGTKNGEQQQKNGETKQNWQRPAKNGQIQSQQQNIQRSNRLK